MSIPLILRTRACMYLDTSLVALSDDDFIQFMTSGIDYRYPKLMSTCSELYLHLVYQSSNFPDLAEPDEWWLGVPIGPTACSRDISDLRDQLRNWFESHGKYHGMSDIRIAQGDEWDDDLEVGLLNYQAANPLYLLPTGYGDCETLRRLRMEE